MAESSILITGTAGFIGFHLARHLLAAGHEVIGVDGMTAYYDVNLKRDRLKILQASKGYAHHEFMIEEGDRLLRLVEKTQPATIVHLAAQAGVRYSIENPRVYVQSNIVGTFNLLETCRSHPPRHLLIASTSSVYGDGVESPSNERSESSQPLSLYAATKRADELMSYAYGHLFGLPQTGLRFFTVYGPWGRPDMAYYSFARAIFAGEPITVYDNGDLKRDFTYVDDIVAGVLGCLDHPPQATAGVPPVRVLNIGNNRAELVNTLISLLEEGLGKKALVRHAPRPAADVEETFADVAAIGALTGYAPTTPLEVGIPRFVAWFRAFHGINT